MQEKFTVPDTISINTLKDLSLKIRTNKKERVTEFLQRKHLPVNFKNIKRALKAVNKSVFKGNLNPDYSEIEVNLEEEFKNTMEIRTEFVDELRTMLEIPLSGDTEEEKKEKIKIALKTILETISGFVVVLNGQILVFPTDYIIECLNIYKNEGHKIDKELEDILDKTEDELDINEETRLMDFFGYNEDFAKFCIYRKDENNI